MQATTQPTQPKTFTPAQLVQIMDSINSTLEAVRDRTWHEGAIVDHERLRNIEGFLAKFARNLDYQGWYEWRVGILWKLREALNVETWLEYYQALGVAIDAAMTLPTGVDDIDLHDDADDLDLGCVEVPCYY